ncbi:gamma-interferon-inducible lysosomal thiol reductase [Aplysia californica]|uniref:Gamma-interferon-inducible lysosomal thiol reductase n=1 Tax=Aplysia californica TaxID=6500 RepID=A0ABM0JC97_APLCA|nr:gamma-interferon-inducible lysosomal thiol reductase [Aplysia californica]XP_005090371.1 gamma-interferon-inducible lysosomal thiol reductase [Aplysia californica]
MKYTVLMVLVTVAVSAQTRALHIPYPRETPMVDLMEATSIGAAPVNVTLYYEVLCGGCHDFITTTLVTAVKALGDDGSIMNFHFIPYGNSLETWNRTTSQWDFSCQHGPEECVGNTVDACVIHYKPKFKDHYRFIVCFEKNVDYKSQAWKEALEKCGKRYDMPVEEIASCVTTKLGNTLEHEMALRTGPHQWVPWLILNGVHTPQAGDNLLRAVCKAYKGPKPKGCP